MRSLIGQTIGKYKIVEHLGRGGMAEVYKGYQETLDRHVAIKLMHSFLADDQDFLSRFKREARAMAALNHPNIVGVYDFDIESDAYYIVMEYVGGGTLKEKLEALAQQGERLSLAQAVQIVLEIADALAYAHSRGMVHRDIKPANIMLTENGRAVLTDFGIAKMLSGPSYTATGAMIGTPAYMSPEQGLGRPGDERSDLYSLGVLFFQMATARLPFDADTPLAVVLKHVNDPIPEPTTINSQLPPAIEAVILKAMAKEPKERFQSAHEMAQTLREAVRSADISLASALPAHLLQDKPTPPPLATSAGATQLSDPAEATRVAGAAAGAGATVLSAGRTEIAPPPKPPETAPAPEPAKRRKLAWAWLLAIPILLLTATAVVAGGIFLANWPGEGRTTEAVAVATDVETPPSEEEDGADPDDNRNGEAPTPTPIDIAAEVDAALTRAAAAMPTATPSPTPSLTPSPTPTPDATATHLAGCVWDVELVVAYTYQSRQSQGAPVGATFPMNWVLKNSGTCPWPEDLRWHYVEGESFGEVDSVGVNASVPPGDEITLRASGFVAPGTAGLYESAWQMVDADGEPFGPALTFGVTAFVPATPTPVPPTPTIGPTATPTPAEVAAVEFNVFLDRESCHYAGDQWRCLITITPFGGGGGPYVIWVFDQTPAAEYRGGNQTHWVSGRRCFSWANEILVRDDASGQQTRRNFLFDPNNEMPGGCTEP